MNKTTENSTAPTDILKVRALQGLHVFHNLNACHPLQTDGLEGNDVSVFVLLDPEETFNQNRIKTHKQSSGVLEMKSRVESLCRGRPLWDLSGFSSHLITLEPENSKGKLLMELRCISTVFCVTFCP